MPHIAHPLSTGNETTTECQFFRESGALGSLSPGNQDELSSFGQVQSKNPWHLVVGSARFGNRRAWEFSAQSTAHQHCLQSAHLPILGGLSMQSRP